MVERNKHMSVNLITYDNFFQFWKVLINEVIGSYALALILLIFFLVYKSMQYNISTSTLFVLLFVFVVAVSGMYYNVLGLAIFLILIGMTGYYYFNSSWGEKVQ
jgi:uncharacterized membrane protein YjgN (DUF898 family)